MKTLEFHNENMFKTGLREECGVFGGIVYENDIAPYIRQGLFMLQHRGQESAGICCGDTDLVNHKDKGLVQVVLADKEIQHIKGKSGIGHVRYSTQGSSDNLHAQPFMIKYMDEKVAIAHNGNVHAAIKMREDLEAKGEVFLTTSDTEIIFKKVIREISKKPSKWNLYQVGTILKDNFTGGAWSLLFGFPGKIMAFRDPLGYRPLVFCEAEEGYFISSEDCAFQLLNRIKVIEIEPGEAIEITPEGYKIERFAKHEIHKKCVFEHIYFARPDSNIFGKNVYTSRVEMGKRLAIEHPIEADVIIPVMDSGFASAIGFSQQSGIQLQMGLLRNHWVGRTFIKPKQQARINSVLEKLTPIVPIIENKRVVLVDDSLVRGTTSREIVKMLKNVGAKEVHIRISSPMLVNTCHWGVDISSKGELIANSFNNVQEINDYIGADSLGYLSFDGLGEIMGNTGWCHTCFEKS